MKLETLMAALEKLAEENEFASPSIDLRRPKSGGWQCNANGGCAWGDTLEDAFQACYDHAHGKKSKHARLNPPYFSTVPRTLENRYAISYDYRKKDWTPNEDPEAVRGQPKAALWEYYDKHKR